MQLQMQLLLHGITNTNMLTAAQKKHITKLHQKKYREEFSQTIIEGEKGVREALAAGWDIELVVLQEDKLIVDLDFGDVQVERCTAAEGKQLVTTDSFPGIFAVINTVQHDIAAFDKGAPVLVLDGVADPGNVGTIIRTADWFGVKQIVLTKGSVELWNPKVVRSAMGSLFGATVATGVTLCDAYEHWKEEGREIVTLEMDGEALAPGTLPKTGVFVLGSESHGVCEISKDAADKKVTIAKQGDAESLNVAMATGILLYALRS